MPFLLVGIPTPFEDIFSAIQIQIYSFQACYYTALYHVSAHGVKSCSEEMLSLQHKRPCLCKAQFILPPKAPTRDGSNVAPGQQAAQRAPRLISCHPALTSPGANLQLICRLLDLDVTSSGFAKPLDVSGVGAVVRTTAPTPEGTDTADSCTQGAPIGPPSSTQGAPRLTHACTSKCHCTQHKTM